MVAPRPNTWLDELRAYIPGKSAGGGHTNPAKMSANETPLGASPRAVEAMRAALAAPHRYPDGSSRKLREAIAAHHDLDVDRIVCGTGSDELIHLLPQAYCAPGDEVLYVRYGFMVYPIAARRAGAIPVVAPDRDYVTDVDALLAAITGKTRVIFIANPNNPTGTAVGRSELQRLIDGVPEHIVILLDAAYAEYADAADYDCGLSFARERPNVIATRTFSKIHGLAAARVGWGYGPKAVMDVLNKLRAPFNVPTAAQAGAIASLEDTAWIAAAQAHNAQWRTWLQDALRRVGLEPVPSAANFILTRVPPETGTTAQALNEALMGEGYIVRYLPDQGLPDCLRISVGTKEETTGLVAALERILKRS